MVIPKEISDFLALRTPMKRYGEMEELQGILVYLASDASTFTTGADILVDGGYTVW